MSTNATDNTDALGGFASDGSLGLERVNADPVEKPAPKWPKEVTCKRKYSLPAGALAALAV